MAAEELLGREAELAVIGSFLKRAASEPTALVIDGEPGIGKTTLWREALKGAERLGLRVLSSRAAEAEAKLSFSALSDLLEPVSDELFAALPDPQRRALEVALLRADPHGRPPDLRAAATAFRSLLTSLAAASPILVAIDDAHWLDASSARAIEFALRRVHDAPVALLVSRRPGVRKGRDSLGTVLSEAHTLELGPLSLAATHELVKRRLRRSLPRPLLLRVHQTAGGNPFFALEIARVVIDTETGPGEPLPLPPDLSELVLARVRRLGARTREALLVVAVAAEPTESLVAATIDADAAAVLDEAEEAGLLERRDGALSFTHPLYAAAVYSSASRPLRRRTHRLLAELVNHVEERARHLALGAKGPDEAAASALEKASAHAKVRGSLDAAAELMELAVRLTPSDLPQEAERRLELGELLRLTGDTDRARELLDELAAGASGPLRARALIELGATRYWVEGSVAGVECCEAALEAAGGEMALEAKAHADLAVYCDFDLDRSYDHAQMALALFERLGSTADPLIHSQALAIASRASLMLGHGLPLGDVDRAIQLEARASDVGTSVAGRISTFSGQWLKYVDDLAGARDRLEAARRQAVEEGDESALPNILAHLAQTELWSGDWRLASRYAEEGCDLAERLGLTFGGPQAFRALVDAHLGRAERARATALEGLSLAKRNPLAAPLHLRVLGFVDLSIGDVAAAARHLTDGLQRMDELRILEPAVLRLHADAVEALVVAGDLERAEAILPPWEKQARKVDLAWSLATGARCRALVEAARGRTDQALESLERALATHGRLPMPFELGRTLLTAGQVERRAKRKAAAKRSLERALAIFERLGAPLWAEKAQAELARVGLRHAPRDELTETERRVAELAASGLTNREVAAKLFVSPKTVEANLARAYRKLDIHSRAELGARLAGVGRAPAQT